MNGLLASNNGDERAGLPSASESSRLLQCRASYLLSRRAHALGQVAHQWSPAADLGTKKQLPSHSLINASRLCWHFSQSSRSASERASGPSALKANAFDGLRFEPLFTGRVFLAVSSDHPFANKQSVSLADAAREPFIGLTRQDYPRYFEYLNAIFARVNDKPRVMEEHDGWSGVFSAVGAGAGVALTSDAFNCAFNDRIKCLRLTPEPKRVTIGIITRKGKLGPAAGKFCQCAKEAFASIR